MPLPWQALNVKYCEADESSAQLLASSQHLFEEFTSTSFHVQHIPGGQKLSRMMGSFFVVPFYLGSSIPSCPGVVQNSDFCLPSPVGLRDAAFCLACIPRSGNWQIPQGGNGDLLCVSLLKAPDVLALLVVLSVPLDSSVCLVFYVTFIVVFSGKFGLILLFPHSLT